MEFGNRKLFPGVSSGAHLRPTAHPEPVIDSPTNSAQEDTRTVLKRTPERYKRHHDTHNAITLRMSQEQHEEHTRVISTYEDTRTSTRDRCIIKNSIISNVCHIQHLQSQNKTRQQRNKEI